MQATKAVQTLLIQGHGVRFDDFIAAGTDGGQIIKRIVNIGPSNTAKGGVGSGITLAAALLEAIRNMPQPSAVESIETNEAFAKLEETLPDGVVYAEPADGTIKCSFWGDKFLKVKIPLPANITDSSSKVGMSGKPIRDGITVVSADFEQALKDAFAVL